MRRRVLRVAVPVAAFALAVAGLDAWSHLRSARSHLQSARAALAGVLDNPSQIEDPAGRARLVAKSRLAHREARAAVDAMDGSVSLTILRRLPLLGRQPRAARLLATDAAAGAAAAVALTEQVQRLSKDALLSDGQVSLAALGDLQASVATQRRRLRRLHRSADGLIGSLAEARRELNQLSDRAAVRLERVGDGIAVARNILGQDRPRTFLLAAENNAEMRDRGMVLSYATIAADNGKLTTTRFGPIADLALAAPVTVPVPLGTEEVFGGLAPTKSWHGVNATADFAWSARTMAEMYRAKTSQQVDGVIAVDVPAMAKLLEVVGAVTVPGVPTAVDGSNASRVLLNDLYTGLAPDDDQAERHGTLGAVAGALVDKLTDDEHDLFPLGRALADAAAGNHLKLWSTDAAAEAKLERAGLGGGPGAIDADRTFHLAVQNGSGNKVDYFVKPRVEMRVHLAPTGTAVIDTTVTVPNTAPAGAQASYQLGPYLETQLEPGEYIGRTYLWAPAKAVAVQGVAESGLRLNYGVLDVPAGQERTIRFHTTILRAVRNGRLELRLVPQPRLDPMQLRVVLDAPGWHVSGPSTSDRAWDRTVTLRWRAVR